MKIRLRKQRLINHYTPYVLSILTADEFLRSVAEPHAGTLTTMAFGKDVRTVRQRIAEDPDLAQRVVAATAHLNATRAELIAHIEAIKQDSALTSEGGVLAGPIASGNKSKHRRKSHI
jgi:hypothetical protein